MDRTKRWTVLAAVLIAAALPARGQGDTTAVAPPWRHALEIGGGPAPLPQQMGLHFVFPTAAREAELAEMGRRARSAGAWFPALNLAWVFRRNEKWEVAVSAGLSWSNYEVYQYATFGTDPAGKPRYDLSEGDLIGRENGRFTGAISVTWRRTWLSRGIFDLYSGVGFGFGTTTLYIPLPELTPVGIRLGGRHFYGFAEATVGPLATFGHGGIGWRF